VFAGHCARSRGGGGGRPGDRFAQQRGADAGAWPGAAAHTEASPSALRGRNEIRRSKPETRRKSEARNPRMARSDEQLLHWGGCGFVIRASAFGLLSAFGFRISDLECT